jgi:hypothetical protein
LRFSGYKWCGLLVVLMMGGRLTGPCLYGAAAADSAAKSTPRKTAIATHPAAKNPTTYRISPVTAVHNTARHSTALPTGAHTTTARGASARSAPAGTAVRKAKAHAASRRPLSGRERLARLHLEPERVQAIQQALGREGYLQGEPNGQWDERTRAAMVRYQSDHGFPATGLPEAKSLMKLGLGSHPLPATLDPGIARANPPDVPKGVSSAGPPSPIAPEATPQPQQKNLN